MAPLKVGFVGTGIFASDFHLPALQAIPEHFTPYSATNRTKSKAEKFAEKAKIDGSKVYDTIEELVKDDQVDFIDALVPVQHNYQVIKTAVDAGKPIIIEKPLAASLEDAKKIVELDKSTKVPILIAEQWVYFKAIELIKERLTKIGDVVSFTHKAIQQWNPNSPFLQTKWRQNPEHIGGFLSDGGVHQIALLTEVLGNIESVSANTRQLRDISGDDDILFSSVKLASGAIGTYTYSTVFANNKPESSLIIYGTNGSIYLDYTDKDHITIDTYVGETTSTNPQHIEFKEDLFSEGIQYEFENLYEAITSNDKSILKATPAKSFHHYAFFVAAIESSKDGGGAVKVAQL
ncbi:Trans-1,2-dihydrobenzene-1,2-diol dehydrogenase [Wickerhamomyces ciferrii]|uniref:Trans-1,2-dihydrobenzene-1,2-diol dehydrogenase n=1 Tax=Wickerhamomyces ciferrii (strain ATCC 14091 / BCRC 22168 / CBS 111 / JCM 3599 / NBRC 0793 / NRRL Y-1031 F-60-10) TaxID=1206466 RepID=K0KM18_WICCF|nr:Trans-1,2-dihydrobenzene-1,2-diol dehydrogenase [Wickerhamomyces ciferrii]CCH42414.1 Trans-1,2-dihydrobenzene-1,2-diol dehydrogenase [Wickerhamomyces ciferrii]